MELALTIFFFALGIVFIVKGGDFFVDAASWIAEISGIPKLIIGATVVSLATTLPEMIVSVMAATQDKVDMSIGNAVGSVTANLGLILAIALICMPGVIKRNDYLMKSVMMVSASVIIAVCGIFGEINVVMCIILLLIFVCFIFENINSAKKSIVPREEDENFINLKSRRRVIENVVKFVLGTAGIVLGADMLVDNGSKLALAIGISERIIGVTLVAVGTSLPELITTITAIVKKQSALSVGNILGANILDLTLIMPIASIISGKALPVSLSSAMIDLPACLLVGVIAVVPAMIWSKFSRAQGIILLTVYAAYVVVTSCVVL
ncbi:MAG: calcium/sodium antiporter [Clostridia bacterium]|nr:calcium/sodium antiporter [Clostridia bacterium]